MNNIFENIQGDKTLWAVLILLAALYTGKNEKPASNIKTAHSVLSPCIFSKILFIIIFLLLL